MKGLSDLSGGLLDLLYPPQCIICGKNLLSEPNQFVCADCIKQVDFIQSPLCLRCGKPFDFSGGSEDHYCGECLKITPYFESARAVASYEQPVVDLLHRLKYRGDTSVTGALKEIMVGGGREWAYSDCDVIAPVPLHRDRLKKRGLNQSLVLAGLAFSEHKIIPDLLVRTKNTCPQTGLNGDERRKNLKSAFEVKNFKLVKNKKILLVDDVFTTGTTVAECSKTLEKAGATAIHVWTFARV